MHAQGLSQTGIQLKTDTAPIVSQVDSLESLIHDLVRHPGLWDEKGAYDAGPHREKAGRAHPVRMGENKRA